MKGLDRILTIGGGEDDLEGNILEEVQQFKSRVSWHFNIQKNHIWIEFIDGFDAFGTSPAVPRISTSGQFSSRSVVRTFLALGSSSMIIAFKIVA